MLDSAEVSAGVRAARASRVNVSASVQASVRSSEQAADRRTVGGTDRVLREHNAELLLPEHADLRRHRANVEERDAKLPERRVVGCDRLE
jgi:hypothetical protein